MPLGGFSLPKRPIFQECWVRQRGREDDADAAPNNAPAADAPRAAPAANGPHDFKTWQSNMAEDIERSDMGHVAEDLKKHRSWFGILFFYHSKLPTKFPQVSNARLHADCACRLADDPQQEHGCSCIATPPHDYNDEEITWCSTITAYLNALLGKQGRAERGLLAVGVHTSARTKA